jgi:hypothetical protein
MSPYHRSNPRIEDRGSRIEQRFVRPQSSILHPRSSGFWSFCAAWLAVISFGLSRASAQESSKAMKSDQPTDWHQSWDRPYEEPDLVFPDEKRAPALKTPTTTPAPSPNHDEPALDGTGKIEDGGSRIEDRQNVDPSSILDLRSADSEEGSAWGDWLRGVSWEAGDTLSYNLHLVWEDYLNYYTFPNLERMALGIALAAPLANTSADRSIRDWYQNKVRDPSADHYALSVKYFGEYTIALPVYFGAALGGKALEGVNSLFSDDESFISAVGLTTNEWGKRCIRALAVGTPMVGVFQVVLGSTRPTLGSSYWNPFNSSHGVSGHAYIGSIPFLTAASMTDRLYLQIPLFLGSFLTGWSRIHTDDHYFSQVALGWWMGFLAVRAVNQTEEAEKTIEFIPGCSEGPGVSMLLRY